jgi:hypothetical protein
VWCIVSEWRSTKVVNWRVSKTPNECILCLEILPSELESVAVEGAHDHAEHALVLGEVRVELQIVVALVKVSERVMPGCFEILDVFRVHVDIPYYVQHGLVIKHSFTANLGLNHQGS